MKVNAWVWQPAPPPSPGNAYRAECRTETNMHVADAPTQQMAQDTLQQELGPMVTIDWHFGLPPRPRRANERSATDKAIEADVIAYKRLCQRFHPDICGKRKFTADQIMQILNEMRGGNG